MIHDPQLTRRTALRVAGAGALAAAILPGARYAVAQDAATSGGQMLSGLGLPELTITMSDSGYEGMPSTAPAGMHLIHLTNNGAEPGFATFMQLPEGMSSAADMMAMLGGEMDATPVTDDAGAEGGEGDMGGPPEWYYQVYMPGGAGVGPGQTAHFIVDMQPGNYILWAEDPTAPQQPVDFTVQEGGTPSAGAAMPPAGVRIVEIGTDGGFAFQVEGTLSGGGQVIEVVNESSQPHFIEFSTVPAGTTREDVDALIGSFMTGTPAAGGLAEEDVQPAYFVGTQSAGTTQWHEVDLGPGTYVLTCWVGDPTQGGIPHAMQGMVEVVEISGGDSTPTS